MAIAPSVRRQRQKWRSKSKYRHYYWDIPNCTIWILLSCYCFNLSSASVLTGTTILSSGPSNEQQPSLFKVHRGGGSEDKDISSTPNQKGSIIFKPRTSVLKSTTSKDDNSRVHHPDKSKNKTTKPGTRMTGVGSHSTKNKSIFQISSNAHSGNKKKPLNGRMYGKLSKNDGLLLYFPPNIHNNEVGKEQEEGILIALSTQWVKDVSNLGSENSEEIRGYFGHRPSIHTEKICGEKKDDYMVTLDIDHSNVSPLKTQRRHRRRRRQYSRKSRLKSRRNGSSKAPLEDNSEWVALEGIYGVYMLPSGPHLVLITKSEETYKTQESLLNIRRIRSMEIISLPLSSSQIDDRGEEKVVRPSDVFIRRLKQTDKRQFRLLRQSFKDHDFYYKPNNNDMQGCVEFPIVKDMTHTLQRSFALSAKTEGNVDTDDDRKEEEMTINMTAVNSSEPSDSNFTIKEANQSPHHAGLEGNETKFDNDSSAVHTTELNTNLSGTSSEEVGQQKDVEKQRNLWSFLSIVIPFISSKEKIVSNITDIGDENITMKYQKRWWASLLPSTATSMTESVSPGQHPDSRFFWNEDSIQPFLQHLESDFKQNAHSLSPYATLLDYTIPVTSAFVGIQKNIPLMPGATKEACYAIHYDQILISRRSKFRAGTRFTRRGSDETGDVANYAESEQICIIHDLNNNRNQSSTEGTTIQEIYSHVQTRGSIPLRWSSPSDIKTYRPRVMIGTDPAAQARALRSHLIEQLAIYGMPSENEEQQEQMIFVNLIDKHSDQGRLGKSFDAVLGAVLDVYKDGAYEISTDETKRDHLPLLKLMNAEYVKHVWFDFHAECKGGRWYKLGKLLNSALPFLDSQGYFSIVPSVQKNSKQAWDIMSLQNGVIRTNCMDCLDRTNVVQSLFGRYILFKQFRERLGLKGLSKESLLGINTSRKLPLEYIVGFKNEKLTLPWKEGEVSHRFLWADNADAISRLYAGTPALKGDFTRTGKRTKRGALDDGMNSLQRYYLNNFLDAYRQEGIDLLVGHTPFDLTLVRKNFGRARDDKLSKHNHGSDGTTEKRKNKMTFLNREDSQLNLNWLPGDLQSHLRSAALLGNDSELPLVDLLRTTRPRTPSSLSIAVALREIDRRASRDLPWWVIEDNDMDISKGKRSGVGHEHEDSTSGQVVLQPSANGGHIIGSLIAATQVPLATAIFLIFFMLPGLLVAATKDSFIKLP